MSVFSWSVALRAAARLGLTPEAFWNLSLKEWRLLTKEETGAVLSRAAFDALCVRHPDAPTDKTGGTT